MAHVLDTTRDCSNLATCLKQQGYTVLIRYYCRADITWKRMMPKEAVALSRAGLKLAAVYQNRQTQPQDFSEAKGKAAGRDAYDYAENSIFQPAGSAIYFSVDFDPSEAVVKNNVVPFFAGIKKAFKEAAGGGAPDYKIGVYGSGRTCRILRAGKQVEFTWLCQSTGFAEYEKYLNSLDWNLKQNMPKKVCGIDCDPDEVNPNDEAFGAFSLDVDTLGPAIPPIEEVAATELYRVIASSGLRVRGGAGVEFEIRSVLPLGTTVRVMFRQGDWAMVDATGDGAADGFVLASYLKSD
jgi:hypothetical protein